MKISNQKPVKLSPVHKATAKGVFDPVPLIEDSLVTPLYTPLIAGNSVTMLDDNGNNITPDDIVANILACSAETLDYNAEAFVKKILEQCLVNFGKASNLIVQELFAIQAGAEAGLPEPSATVIYSPSADVIPVAKKFLAGQVSYEFFFASLAFFTRSQTFGVYFASEVAFDDFKAWVNTQMQTLSSVLSADTNALFQQFANLKLSGLTESLVLRNNDGDNNQEFSFARLLHAFLMEYTNQVSNAEFGLLPFNLGELFSPKTLVMVNVERHSKATAKQVADEWKLINQSIQMKVKVVSNNKLNSLTGTMRTLQKIQGTAGQISSQIMSGGSGKNGPIIRANRAKFRKTPPTSPDMLKLIKKIMDKMTTVNKSDNTFKSVKPTFSKPNRRDPDDFNKQGKVVSTKYKPDIHIYLDTSGSVSERNYQDAIKSLITMAKRLNVNLYFNSFSHCLSQCTKLKTKDKSTKAVYAEFQKVPKVSGGTDYEQIWEYIEQSKIRKRELSLIITDFEYTPPNKVCPHNKNIYYLPLSNMNWKNMTYYASQFIRAMAHIEPNIRKKVLF